VARDALQFLFVIVDVFSILQFTLDQCDLVPLLNTDHVINKDSRLTPLMSGLLDGIKRRAKVEDGPPEMHPLLGVDRTYTFFDFLNKQELSFIFQCLERGLRHFLVVGVGGFRGVKVVASCARDGFGKEFGVRVPQVINQFTLHNLITFSRERSDLLCQNTEVHK